MLIDKDAAIAAIRRLEIDGPQMIWSSDAIDAVKSVKTDTPHVPDVDKVIRGLEHCDKCPTCAGCSYDHEFEVCQMFKEALALITAQRRTLDEIDKYVRELDKEVNGNG